MAAFYDPDGVLIDWKDGPGWTLTDAHAGIFCTGASGSGKSSGVAAMLRKTFLRSTRGLPGGMGGMVFFAKNGEASEWEAECRKLGRGSDVVRIFPGGPCRFNFMDWIARWGCDSADAGGEGRGPIPTVALLEEIGSVVSPESAGGGEGENAFFTGAHRNKLTNLVHISQLAGLPVSLPLMRAISNSQPETPAEAESPAWRKASICWQVLREAEARTRNDPAAYKDYQECRTYFLQNYCSLSSRTRGVVEIMFDGLSRPFLTRPLRPIFCEGSNVTPELMFKGAIFLIDLPVQEYHLTGKLAALAFKRTAQLAIQRRSGKPGTLRPCFMFADECQNFLSPKDEEYQAVARSAGGVSCYLTQQISSVREALGSHDKAENLISNLSTKFFCMNTGETARYAQELIGERYTSITGINIGHSASADPYALGSGGTSGGVNRSEQKRYWLEASMLQKLRRGGKANNFIVDTVVFAGGKLFQGEKEKQPFKILSFRQE